MKRTFSLQSEEIEKRKVLLVDDEISFSFSAGVALRIAGYQVETANDGIAAMKYFSRTKDTDGDFDLLVTDIMMPGRSGVELIEELHERGIRIPILVISGYYETEVRMMFRKKYDFEFLEKPFTPCELIRKVQLLINNGVTPGNLP